MAIRSVAGPTPGKKRGRPSKAEMEARRRAEATGDEFFGEIETPEVEAVEGDLKDLTELNSDFAFQKLVTVRATIVGVTALLQHRFIEGNEVSDQTRAVHIPDRDPRTIAEQHANRMPDGQLYVPGSAIARLLREAGGAYKQRGSRRSLKYILPAGVIVLNDFITIWEPDRHRPVKVFEVDSRPVVIPSTKGRIMQHRPRVNKWSARFDLEIDTTLMEIHMVHRLLIEGGLRLGIGDYRPEKGGPYGRFRVVRWEETDQRELSNNDDTPEHLEAAD